MDLLDLIVLLVCLLLIYYLRNGAVYLPTMKRTVDDIVRLARVKPGMRAVDLGSGDGRIVIALALSGADVVGFENNPLLVLWSKYKIMKHGLSDRAKIRFGSFWTKDLSSFDIVITFGITHIMGRLEKKLRTELKSGSIVILNIFQFPNWQPSDRIGTVRVYQQ